MQRNTETKNKIQKVFVELMNEKGFQALTVSDITRKAQINRGTFYLHYIDKFDLLEKVEDELIENLRNILLDDSEVNLNDANDLIPYTCIYNALVYAKQNFDCVSVLVKEDPNFVQKFRDVLRELLISRVKESDTLHLSMQGLPQDYAYEILLSNVASVVLLWIKKGGTESIADIATIIAKAKEISPYQILM